MRYTSCIEPAFAKSANSCLQSKDRTSNRALAGVAGSIAYEHLNRAIVKIICGVRYVDLDLRHKMFLNLNTWVGENLISF